MNLLITYIVTLVVAQSLAVGAGLFVDRMYSSHAGLITFLALYFVMFVLAWKLAVRLTEPKSTSTASAAPTPAP
jgi:hypothetical protein